MTESQTPYDCGKAREELDAFVRGDLPIGEADPTLRLQAIRATTGDLKERQQAVGAAFLIDLTQFAAPTLIGLAARVAHRQPFFNLVITNVPGPQVPLYCMGGRMLEAYPVAGERGRVTPANAFHGVQSMFEKAGFTVVETRQWNKTTPVRPIMRLELTQRA